MYNSKLRFIPLIILAALALLPYLGSLHQAFVSDDIATIVNNPRLGDWSQIFWQPLAFIPELLKHLAYAIGGLNPAVFRAFNLLAHTGNVLLIYFILSSFPVLLSKAGNRQKPLSINLYPFLIAAIFAVHPLLSESVAWISGGVYAWYTLFFLISFGSYLRAREAKDPIPWQLIAVAFFILTLETNDKAIPLFLIFPLYEILLGNLKRHWRDTLPYALLSLAWGLAYFFTFLQGRISTLAAVNQLARGLENPLLVLPTTIGEYLKLFVWPIPLTLYHSEISFAWSQYLPNLLLTLLILGLISWGFWARPEAGGFAGRRAISFWLLFFLLSISLTTSLAHLRIAAVVAERYAYLGTIGLIAASIVLLRDIYTSYRRHRSHGMLLPLTLSHWPLAMIVLIGLLGLRTWLRNHDWQSEDTLWLAAANVSPSSPPNHNNLGDLYYRRGDLQRAAEEFETAIRLKPDYADAYHNLGNTYQTLGQIEAAQTAYEQAIRHNPNLWQSWRNLGLVLIAQGETAEGQRLIEQSDQLKTTALRMY